MFHIDSLKEGAFSWKQALALGYASEAAYHRDEAALKDQLEAGKKPDDT